MNLKEAVQEMINSGARQVDIAKEANTSPQMINLVVNGRTPRYDIGKRIEEAHKRIMRNTKRKQAKESQK